MSKSRRKDRRGGRADRHRRLGGRGRGWVPLLAAALGAALLVALLAALRAKDRRNDGGAGRPDADRMAEASLAADVGVPRIDDLSGLDPTVRDAITLAVGAVERRPSDASAWGELGIVYHAHRYFALAERCYAPARRLDPRSAEWPHLLGILAEERGSAERAAGLYREALERSPGLAAARYRLGNVLLVEGRLEQAEETFAALAAAAPAEPWGPLGLGRVAQRRGAPDDAARHFERALETDRGNPQAAYLLATAYRELGRDDEARRFSEPARRGVKPVGPADPILDRVRGGVRSLQAVVQAANQALAAGNAEAAEVLYLEVLRADPEYHDALFNLGLVYGRQQRFTESQRMLERAVAVRPRNSQARLLLALSLASQDRLEEARLALRALLEHEPGHSEARALLEEMER